MSHHFVKVDNLSYRYPGGSTALNAVSFTIIHGESVAIVGANGAGKSTLLLHLNGSMITGEGKEAAVNIGNIPVNKNTVNSIRKKVGMVFQNPDDQLFMPTVFDDVAFGPLNLGIPVARVKEIVTEALNQVGALHLITRPPYSLSFGEKRLVAIAGTLALSPDILVLDEPSSNLDPFARRNLIRLLQSFSHTKIIASHDLDLVLELCARTIVLHQGEIKADGATPDIFNNNQLLAACHLEKPLRLQGCPVCGTHD